MAKQENSAKPATDEQVREREKNAQDDPIARRQEERVNETQKWVVEPNGWKLYGTLHLHYRDTQSNTFLGDSDTRVGVEGLWQYAPLRRWFTGIEAGVNVLNQLDLKIENGSQRSASSSDDDIVLRLAYLGIETPDMVVIAGKNWSTYYQVASFTDRFAGTGGNASGAYNAGTDGGPTGTGRADRVIQSRFLLEFPEHTGIKPFHVNVQFQYGEPIPNVDNASYDLGFGVSMIYETRNNLSIGLSYNRANISESSTAIQNAGIDGDAQAALIGIRWFDQNWYLGTTVARLKNIETTDQNIYFDGWGWEVYGQYQVAYRWWAIAGWNILRPDSEEIQAGQYELKYAVAGVRYSIKDFARYVYFNAMLNDGRNADGTPAGNVYTLGVKWSF